MSIALNKERLKECREKMGLTKMEAAAKIKVSQPAYLRYESGERQPSIQVVSEIAQAFNTSVDYLTGFTDEKEPDYVILNKKEVPIIFEIVKKCENLNEEQLRKILDKLREI